jgi:chromosome segregation ATPase
MIAQFRSELESQKTEFESRFAKLEARFANLELEYRTMKSENRKMKKRIESIEIRQLIYDTKAKVEKQHPDERDPELLESSIVKSLALAGNIAFEEDSTASSVCRQTGGRRRILTKMYMFVYGVNPESVVFDK